MVREYTKVLREEVLIEKKESLDKELKTEAYNEIEKTWEDIEL